MDNATLTKERTSATLPVTGSVDQGQDIAACVKQMLAVQREYARYVRDTGGRVSSDDLEYIAGKFVKSNLDLRRGLIQAIQAISDFEGTPPWKCKHCGSLLI